MSNVRFCEFCGRSLKKDGSCVCPEAGRNAAKGGGRNNYPGKTPKPGVLAVAVLLVVAVVAGVLLASGTEKVDLAQYLETKPIVKGMNGQASIDVYDLFDRSGFENDLLESMPEIKDTDNVELVFTQGAKNMQECGQAVDDIVVTVWKDGVEVQELTGLSNGNVIKVEAKSLNPTNKYLKKKFQSGTVEFTIEDLADGKAVDAFKNAGLEVFYTGINGKGQVNLVYKSDAMPELPVVFEVKNNTYAYSNGDAVEVSVKYDKTSWEAKGYYPLEETRTYVVEGLGSYLSSMEDLKKEQLDEMKKKVEADLHDEVADEWADGVSIENLTYLGAYLMTKKETNTGFGPENLLHLVYKVDVFENFAPNGGDDNHFSYYYYGTLESLTLDLDGNVAVEDAVMSECYDFFTRDVKTGSSILMGWSYMNYTGYETLEELYSVCVTNYADQYDYISTVEDNK